MSVIDGVRQLKIADSIYSPIASTDKVIRVLELLPGQFGEDIVIRLHAVHLNVQPIRPYEALSYVWGVGTPTSSVRISDKDGPGLPITANLESALRYLRQSEGSRTLWIDALCINQMDLHERGAQVQLMGDIYTAADRVIVWLGPVEDDIEFKHSLAMLQVSDKHPRSDLVRLAPTIYRILQRPWFERTWVVQELALSELDPVVMVGHCSFTWKSLLRCASSISNRLDQIPGVEMVDFQDRQERANSFDIIRIAKRTPDRQDDAFFAYQLRRTLYLSATDPRDKVFGLLGISEFETERLMADYTKSTMEVYTEATAYMLRNRYVSLFFEAPLRPMQDHHIQLGHPSDWPTWVPNFSFATKNTVKNLSFKAARRSYSMLIEPPMDNLPLMLNIQAEERVDMLAQNLPHNLTAALFATDTTRMNTYGLYAGSIVATSKGSLRHIDWAEPAWLSLNSVYGIYHDIVAPNKIGSADYLCALLPEEHRYTWRFRPGAQQHECAIFDAFLNADRDNVHLYSALFQPRNDVDPGPFARNMHDTMQELAEAISSLVKDRVVFVTDQGHVGLSYHEEPTTGIQNGDSLVGLFGVNFPFILRRNETTAGDDHVTYRMVNVASVANHQWGHDFLGNIFTASGYPDVKTFKPDISWKDFEIFGMKEYVIS